MATGDTIKVTFSQAMRPAEYVVTRDTIVVDQSGRFHVVKAGTKITLPTPDGPVRMESEPI